MAKLLSFIFILLSFQSSAQKIYGIVFNDKGDLLPYSSLTIKKTSIGSSANSSAKFSINATPGIYTVVCQHIGYKTQEKTVTIKNNDEELNFVLTEQKLTMKEIVIKTGGEDPAYAIIRQAIKKRPYYVKEVDAFTCDLYGKDILKLRHMPEKIFGKKVPAEDRKDMLLDTTGAGIIYLSESVSKISSKQPNKFKLEVKSSRVSGSGGFGFTFPTFISLYQNNVTIFAKQLNPRGFVSPIADGALNFYKYKFLGSYYEDGKEINSIRVIPKRAYEPLFSGIINITEDDWRIHSVDLVVTKKSQLEILDTLQLTQFHVPVGDDKWRVKNQLLHFNLKFFGIDAIGNFVNVYSNYNLHPAFDKKFFDNVVIKYDTNVNKKPRAYWDTIRPVPLEKDEVKDYHLRDSIYQVEKDSAFSKSSIDTLKKRQGKIKPLGIFWGGIHRTHYSNTNQYNWSIEGLIPQMEYNPAEGVVINASGSYQKYLKKAKTNLTISPNIRYGFSNGHLNGWLDINLRTRDFEQEGKLKQQSWTFSGGRRVTQFNRESPITPLINTISTLLYGNNLMKTYENIFGNIVFAKRYENGLRLSVGALYEDRKPLNNTTNYTFFNKYRDSIKPNYPIDRLTAQFTPHKAFIIGVNVSFKPGQKYIQLPYSKIPLGSKYPTFSVNYSKGIENILGSDVNFDKWKFTIYDDMNLKLAGTLKYKIGIGGFLNDKKVYIQDYQHFNGNQTIAASEYVNSFQIANYYVNSTTAPFYAFGHLEHHFNGMLTNKIPLFKRLNWNLVAGTNSLFVNQKTNHVEIFAGLENIFKIFRVDFVAAYVNGNGRPYTGIRIGTGGLLGSSINLNGKGGGTVSFQF